VKTKKIFRYEPVGLSDQEFRLDKWLSQFDELGSRTYILSLIDQGLVRVDDRVVFKSSFKIANGMRVEVHLPELEPLNLAANYLPLDIVHEDSDLVVIDKPAGLVVHPSLGHHEDSLVHRLLGHCHLSSGNTEDRPGVVHRLDKDTSGLIVLAKSDFAHRHLSEQFKQKTAFRIYEAICFGKLLPPIGLVCSYLNRHPIDRKKRASVRDVTKKIIREYYPDFEKGKWAVTHFRALSEDKSGQLSLVELKLETGRTHQIRVHLSEMGHPIVGDDLYGADKRLPRLKGAELKLLFANSQRVFLHARELGFVHPRSQAEVIFRRDWPKAILELRDQLF